MSFTNGTESSILGMILNGTAIAGIADNAASGTLTNLYVALYTADPGETGTAITNEANYTSYLRVAIARNPSSPAWTISGTTQAANAATVTFQTSTGGSNVLTHFGVVSTSTGAGVLYGSGALGASITVAVSGRPQFDAAALVISLE